MGDLIKYGMGRDYLPDWGVQEALREIVQNFKDFGEYELKVYEGGSCVELVFKNSYVPEDACFLRIGQSGKRDDSSKVGKHGEGLKMAAMVLLRAGHYLHVVYRNMQFSSVFYEDAHLGECFGFGVHEYPGSDYGDAFAVVTRVWKDDYEAFMARDVSNKTNVVETSHGRLLLDCPAGEVYVDGQFVSVVKGLKYAYDFKPWCINLDRDRRVPRSFDVEYHASRILEEWQDLSLSDLSYRDANYIGRIPSGIAKKFTPSMAGGKVVFRAEKGTVQASENIAQVLMKDAAQKKRVEKLKYNLTRKRTPHSILKEFFDKRSHLFGVEDHIDVDVLLKKAKGWKIGS